MRRLPLPGDKGRPRKREGKRGLQPGILSSWEAFNDEAMHDFLDEVVRQFEQDLDEMEQALRSQN